MKMTSCVWGDIATVESGYTEPVRNSMTYNGEHAVGIAVAAASGTDIVKVGNAVERRLAELQEERFLQASLATRSSINPNG